MVRRRILAEEQQGIRVLEILERDGSLAYAHGSRQTPARGFVAHVRTVGEIVGAVHAHEQLVQEGGFVARATRGIEGGAVRVIEAIQVVGDQRERVVPRNGYVAVTLCIVDERIGQAAMLLKLVIRLRHQLFDGMFFEKCRRDALAGGLGGHGFYAVLAEFERGRVLAIRPRATGAIETVRLVLAEKRAVIAPRRLLLEEIEGHILERAPAGCWVRIGFNARFGFFHSACRGFLRVFTNDARLLCSENDAVYRKIDKRGVQLTALRASSLLLPLFLLIHPP